MLECLMVTGEYQSRTFFLYIIVAITIRRDTMALLGLGFISKEVCQFEKLQCCGKSSRHQRNESILECVMSKSFDFTNESKFPVAIIVALTAGVTILLWTGFTILLKSDWSVFLIHPIDQSNMFIVLMFFPLLISTRIRILRHQREEVRASYYDIYTCIT